MAPDGLIRGGKKMAELSNEDIRVLGRAVGLDIGDDEVSHVTHSLNAIIEGIDEIEVPGMNDVEPLPIILPPKGG